MFLNAIAKGNIQKNSTIFQEFRQRSKDLEIVPYRENLSTFQGYPISLMISCYLTTLIKSNAMKKLITLIFSAVLLCPMWAGAQSITRTLEDISWSGSLSLPIDSYPIVSQATAPYRKCNTITNITLQIQLPSNNSAIIPVNGVYNCSPSDNSQYIYPTPLSGTMVGMANAISLATQVYPATFYRLQLRLSGPATLECATNSHSDLSMSCDLYTITQFPTVTGPSYSAWTSVASGSFTTQ